MKKNYKMICGMAVAFALLIVTAVIYKLTADSAAQLRERAVLDYMLIQDRLLASDSEGNADFSFLERLYLCEESDCIRVDITDSDGNQVYEAGQETIVRSVAVDDEKSCGTVTWRDGKKYLLQLTGLLKVQEGSAANDYNSYVLNAVYDITYLYKGRLVGMNVSRLFIILASAVIAYIIYRQVLKPEKELEQSVATQEEFIGSFSHELKTPMTSIIGYADLIRSHQLSNDEMTEAAGYIFSEGKRLESLSLKMMELLVADDREAALVMVNPADIIYRVVNIMKPTLAKENIVLKSTCENSLVMADVDLFQSLITNLADNARKAMDAGGEIHIQGRVKNGRYIIQIRDNGRGMTEEELRHITEAFYRADKSRSRAQGGAGLGLAICSRIADIHNAELEFKSVYGKGTIVTVRVQTASKNKGVQL